MSRPHTELVRRRIVSFGAIAVGVVLLAATLHVQRDSAGFYAAGFGLAAVWIVASLASRPLFATGVRTVLAPHMAIGALVGVAMYGVFAAAAVVARHVSFLRDPIDRLLSRADAGPVAAVLALALVNGIAEELFFRSALPTSIGGHWSFAIATLTYVGVTAVGGNTALTLAAAVMGTVFAIEAHRSRNLVMPITTHLVWTTLVVLALPR